MNELKDQYLTLELPNERYQSSFLEGAAEFADEGRLESTYARAMGYDLAALHRDFHVYVWDLKRLGNKSEHGYVDVVHWLIDREEYIGQASVRPELATPYLITYGGHIGYSIRPMRRRRGYGKHILGLALEKSRRLGLERVLVTCDADNLASKKIIESNGGQFEIGMKMDAATLRVEGRVGMTNLEKLRYWIDLSDLPQRNVL
jgi:predicted acetyltransferase